MQTRTQTQAQQQLLLTVAELGPEIISLVSRKHPLAQDRAEFERAAADLAHGGGGDGDWVRSLTRGADCPPEAGLWCAVHDRAVTSGHLAAICSTSAPFKTALLCLAGRRGCCEALRSSALAEADPCCFENLPGRLAAEAGHAGAVELLLDRGVPASALVAAAARGGSVTTLTTVLRRFPTMVPDASLRSMMHEAARGDHEGVARFLMGLASAVGSALPLDLLSAVRFDSAKVAGVMLEYGADARDPHALQEAAARGSAGVAARLLAGGADARDPEALLAAAKHGHVEVGRILMDAGADATPPHVLQTAAASGHLDMVALLLDRGAQPTPSGLEELFVLFNLPYS